MSGAGGQPCLEFGFTEAPLSPCIGSALPDGEKREMVAQLPHSAYESLEDELGGRQSKKL